MEAKTIQLEGINRNVPGNTAPDGACQEIINARFEEGAWRPIGTKKLWKSIPASSVFAHYIHELVDGRFTIVYYSGTKISYRLYNADESLVTTGDILDSYDTSKEIGFTSLGNVLVIINKTIETHEWCLFEHDTNAYKYFGDPTPELPIISFGCTHLTPTVWELFTDVHTGGGNGSVVAAEMEGLMNEMIDRMTRQGYPYGVAYLRYAFELFDGTIIKHSTPVQVQLGFFSDWEWDYEHDYYVGSYHRPYPTYTTETYPTDTVRNLYSKIIRSVNIYCSALSCVPKINQQGWKDDPVYPEFKDVSNFYLVGKIDWKDIDGHTTGGLLRHDLTDLVSREVIGLDNFTHHGFYSQKPFLYNHRIMWSDIKVNLFRGFKIEMFNPTWNTGTGGRTCYPILETVIKTDEGDKHVYTSVNDLFIHDFQNLTLSYFSYPDARATKVRLVVKESVTNLYFASEYQDIVAHSTLNLAYCEETTFTASIPIAKPNMDPVGYWDNNRVQATEIGNPFILPAINSYQVGSGTLLGLQSNALPVSEGQFGQFPVYAFCTHGIYSMQVGETGDTLIVTVVPVSDHVCNNAESITPVVGGVLFTTVDGLYVIQGGQVQEISEKPEGDVTSPLSGNSDYESWIDSLTTYRITDLISSVNFKTYLSGANIGYDDNRKEIILCNNAYDYSYVYSLKYGAWSKMGQSWQYFLHRFPNTYGVRFGETIDLHDLSQEDTTSAIRTVPMHVETRPIKLAPGFKKIDAAILRGYFNPLSGKGYGFLVFGSTTGKTWQLLTGRKPTGESYDINTYKTGFSVREIIVVTGGYVDHDTFLTHLDLAYSPTFHGKMR